MKLDLAGIIQVPGGKMPFDFTIDLSGLDFRGEYPVTDPVRFFGSVENKAGALFLNGEIHTVLSLVCDRCLAPFRQEKIVPVSFLLAQHIEREEDEEEILLLDGTELDLDAVCTEALVLAMDTKFLCSDDCKGLCNRCGANLNLGPCGCKPEVDPRLAALAQLLDDKN